MAEREALKTNTHDRWEEMLSTAGFIFTTCFIPSVAGSPPSCMTDNERPSASKLSSLSYHHAEPKPGRVVWGEIVDIFEGNNETGPCFVTTAVVWFTVHAFSVHISVGNLN